MAGMKRFCLVISWRISHLGMKPVRGGSPPRERRVNMNIIVSSGDLVEEMAIELIFVTLLVLSNRNSDDVIII